MGIKSWKFHFNGFRELVQTTTMKFENAALSLLFGLPSTIIRHESGSFLKTLFKPEEFKFKRWLRVLTRADGDVFENDIATKNTWFPWPSSSITNANWPLIVALLISPTYNVDKKHLMHFGRENTVSKFLRSVYEASECLWYSCQKAH